MGRGSSPRARGTLRARARQILPDRFIPACAGNAGHHVGGDQRRAVHPRVRGERPDIFSEDLMAYGSSPRARGTHLALLHRIEGSRFIPACAGNAAPRHRTRGRRAVHPRVRGERVPTLPGRGLYGGSSPRARGTPSPATTGRNRNWFIPACAGNARWWAAMAVRSSVHPRVRGERVVVRNANIPPLGSSPRARGTRRRARRPARRRRFIPACAGNAVRAMCAVGRDAVHPRVRGERVPAPCRQRLHGGSSPRARGTRTADERLEGVDRFIPACAGNARSSTRRASPRPVHPRVRGERVLMLIAHCCPIGSSPRARGTLLQRLADLCPRRFIPACAGNARLHRRHDDHVAVHPRVRGERSRTRWRSSRTGGSSPRARGTRGGRRAVARLDRFIPACAGNAARAMRHAGPPAVHPRVRGERGCRTCPTTIASGSSPRARGTPCRPSSSRVAARFIPACAGNASSATPAAAAAPVHPRVRGERLDAAKQLPPGFGSSPRARGTHVPGGFLVGNSRFIPACAGNAIAAAGSAALSAVHPRVRGERQGGQRPTWSGLGSSPRARGTRSLGRLWAAGARFIPACAGNASSPPPSRREPAVHPRVRGERRPEDRLGREIAGSSPRARGTRSRHARRRRNQRFIPACAGNAPAGAAEASSSTVHPRVRGERPRIRQTTTRATGSSPRARGTQARRRPAPQPDRFIPACAGNASATGSSRSRTPVHPRVRGERGPPPPCAGAPNGSSPRARGTQL